ncbi:MAG TPA: APH(3') family aminoglycoside O-phosphotransferase [Pyrinomonadaceae bacterium]|jgi:aminoglycoside phosphotransferase
MTIETLQQTLPQILSEMLSGYAWQQNFTGFSSSQVFHLKSSSGENLYLKTAPCVDSELAEEKQRLEWLKGKLSVPEVRLFVQTDERDYLLISEIEGAGAHEDLWKEDVPRAIELLSKGVRMIHSLPVADCPFDETLEAKIERARRRIELGLVDESDFDDERQGRTAEDLFRELIATKPASEDLVFTHGDYCLPNVLFKDWQISGFVDWGRAGVADRYQDIALLTRSVCYNFGEKWTPFVFEALEIEPDWERIDFYKLLDEFF